MSIRCEVIHTTRLEYQSKKIDNLMMIKFVSQLIEPKMISLISGEMKYNRI